MTEFHCDQVVPFEIYYVSFELFGDDEPVWNLARKARLPNSLEDFWGGMLAHNIDNTRCCYCSSIWEAFKKSSDSKPMISMAMRNIDRCQVLAACSNPIR